MDPLILGLLAIMALFIFMQFRSSKKRRAEQEAMSTKMVPGAEVMTQFGLFGTLLSIDDDSNEALVETTPGTIVRVHRQVIMKVVENEAAEAGSATEELDEPSALDEPGMPEAGDDKR